MTAFNYVMNAYHVNNAGGIEDITRNSELPHVLLARGNTYRVHPYWGEDDDTSTYWDAYVWSQLYDDEKETDDEMEYDSGDEYPYLGYAFPSDRTYIDIIAEGENQCGQTRRVRAILKIFLLKDICASYGGIGGIRERGR